MVLLAGFSQGGAVALYTGLRYPERLAGILAMSCYLPFPERLAAEKSAANADVPILLCHGRGDPVVPIGMGLEARDELKAHGYAPEWRDYPMQHAVCMEEIADVARWLNCGWQRPSAINPRRCSAAPLSPVAVPCDRRAPAHPRRASS